MHTVVEYLGKPLPTTFRINTMAGFQHILVKQLSQNNFFAIPDECKQYTPRPLPW